MTATNMYKHLTLTIITRLLSEKKWYLVSKIGSSDLLYTLKIIIFSFPALIYQGILSLNLSAGTRSTIEDFGVFFEPQKAAVSAGRIVRNAYFAWFGRVVFNLLTNPATTMQELTQIGLL